MLKVLKFLGKLIIFIFGYLMIILVFGYLMIILVFGIYSPQKAASIGTLIAVLLVCLYYKLQDSSRPNSNYIPDSHLISQNAKYQETMKNEPTLARRSQNSASELQYYGREDVQDCIFKFQYSRAPYVGLSYELREHYKTLVDGYYDELIEGYDHKLRAMSSDLSSSDDELHRWQLFGFYTSVELPELDPSDADPITSVNINHRPPNMPIVVTRIESSHNAVKNLEMRLKKSCVLGLDCEWNTETRRGERNKVATLQLAAADGYCVIFQLSVLGGVPWGSDLMKLLSNSSVIKTGVGIKEDARRLFEDYGVVCKPFLDLRYLADRLGYEPRSLKILSERYLGRRLQPSSIFVNWESRELSQKLINYAADDAWASVDLFVLFSYLLFRKRRENWENNLSGTRTIFHGCMNYDFCYERWRHRNVRPRNWRPRN